MEDDQQFCLRWNNHKATLISVFDSLLENEKLVDCTLAAEGKILKAHKVVLSACSPYFATLLSQHYDKHPIFIIKDVKYQELKAMMDYMYRGEVNISQDQLAALLKAAESLQIKGLSDNRSGGSQKPEIQEHNIPVPGIGGGVASSIATPAASTTTSSSTLLSSAPTLKQQSGFSIEQQQLHKRTQKQHINIDPDISDSREGSTSPISRKRKKLRRKTVDTNNLTDNHELSNSSSQSQMSHHHPITSAVTTNNINNNSSSTSVVAMPQNTSTSATSAAAYVLNVTKKTDQQIHLQETNRNDMLEQSMIDTGDENDDIDSQHHNQQHHHHQQQQQQQHHHQQQQHQQHQQQQQHQKSSSGQELMDNSNNKDKMEAEMLLEPKSEYDEVTEDPVEDLTMEDDELLEDLDQAGPSHGGETSSQGYAQWQVERSQDEVFLAAQEAAGQHRDAQDLRTTSSTMTMAPQPPLPLSSIVLPSSSSSLSSSSSSSSSLLTPANKQTTPSTTILYEPEITIHKLFKCCSNSTEDTDCSSCTITTRPIIPIRSPDVVAAAAAATVAVSVAAKTAAAAAIATFGSTVNIKGIMSPLPKKNSITQYHCPHCVFICTWKYDLKLHLKQKHGIHKK